MSDNPTHVGEPVDDPGLDWLASLTWWERVIDRMIRTAAQTAMGAGVGSAVLLSELNPLMILSTVGVSVLVTLLMALATPRRV